MFYYFSSLFSRWVVYALDWLVWSSLSFSFYSLILCFSHLILLTFLDPIFHVCYCVIQQDLFLFVLLIFAFIFEILFSSILFFTYANLSCCCVSWHLLWGFYKIDLHFSLFSPQKGIIRATLKVGSFYPVALRDHFLQICSVCVNPHQPWFSGNKYGPGKLSLSADNPPSCFCSKQSHM